MMGERTRRGSISFGMFIELPDSSKTAVKTVLCPHSLWHGFIQSTSTV